MTQSLESYYLFKKSPIPIIIAIINHLFSISRKDPLHILLISLILCAVFTVSWAERFDWIYTFSSSHCSESEGLRRHVKSMSIPSVWSTIRTSCFCFHISSMAKENCKSRRNGKWNTKISLKFIESFDRFPFGWREDWLS